MTSMMNPEPRTTATARSWVESLTRNGSLNTSSYSETAAMVTFEPTKPRKEPWLIRVGSATCSTATPTRKVSTIESPPAFGVAVRCADRGVG
jgi:hypothetical protein